MFGANPEGDMDDLTEARDDMAEMAYDSFESFWPRPIARAESWERDGDSWVRTVTFAPETPDGRPDHGHFTVLFGPGKGWIETSYGWADGQIVERGQRPGPGR
jgi:hypothetical protein